MENLIKKFMKCVLKKEKVLAIGDNLRTDIKGANNLNIDSLFIYNGVHRNEFKIEERFTKLFKKYKVKTNFFQKNLNGKMKIYNNLNIKKNHKNAVIAIGNFDGIHLGHQKVLNKQNKKQKKINYLLV